MTPGSSFEASSLTGRDVVRHFLRREVKAVSFYEPLVHEGADIEGVHQLRVSARRLRSELQAMRGVLPRDPWRELEEDLRWMGAELGRLRDLDVLTELFDDHLTPGSALHTTVAATLAHRRERRRRDVIAMLDTSRYARIVKRLRCLRDHPSLGDVGHTLASDLFYPRSGRRPAPT